jgi:hypothetical protein
MIPARSRAIVVFAVAALVCVTVACASARKAPERVEDLYDRKGIDVGDTVRLPAARVGNGFAVLIFGTRTCPVCLESGPLFASLASAAKARGIPLYFVGRDNDGEDAAPPEALRINAGPAQLGVFRFPSIVLIDERGLVRAIHVGMVEPSLHESLLERLLGAAPEVAAPIRDMGPGRAEELSRDKGAQLIDAASHGPSKSPLKGAVPIPAAELTLRARYELDRKRAVVVDCRPIGRFACQGALFSLRQSGFAELGAVGYGSSDGSLSRILGL